MKEIKNTDLFDVGDPFEYLAQQTCKLSGKLQISPDFVNEAIAIIKGAFGEQWIRNSFNDKMRGSPLIPMTKHPISRNLLAPSASTITTIYELAIYIKRLLHIKNLHKVLEMMKSQYAEGLMQLAFAYRFLRLGSQNLEFEPKARGGRLGDIFFELEGKQYMVECYIPRSKACRNSSTELRYCINPIFNAINSANKILRVYIALKQKIGHQERKEIQRMIISAIKQPSQHKNLEIENPFAKVIIDDISDMKQDVDFPPFPSQADLYGKADWGVRQHKVPGNKKVILQIREGKYKHKGIYSRIFVKDTESERSEVSVEERIKELTKKIEKKLAQTRISDGNVRRIVIAQVIEGREVGEGNIDSAHICRQIQRNIVAKHSSVSAVFLCVRTWTAKMRHVYMGVVLLGTEKDAISDTFLDRLNNLEDSGNWLDDWR